MRCRRPKTIMLAKVTRCRPITARAVVTFWFQKLIFGSGIPPLGDFSPRSSTCPVQTAAGRVAARRGAAVVRSVWSGEVRWRAGAGWLARLPAWPVASAAQSAGRVALFESGVGLVVSRQGSVRAAACCV